MERKFFGVFACLLALVAAPAIGQDDCGTSVNVGWPGSIDLDPCTDANPTGFVAYGGCTSGGGVNDLWINFVATDARARIRTDIGSVGSDSDYIVLGSATPADATTFCGGGLFFTAGGCSEDEVGYLGDIVVEGLNVGDTYMIVLGGWGDACGPFRVTVEDAPPLPTLPQWGLLGLGVLLLGGGAVVFGRLRFVA